MPHSISSRVGTPLKAEIQFFKTFCLTMSIVSVMDAYIWPESPAQETFWLDQLNYTKLRLPLLTLIFCPLCGNTTAWTNVICFGLNRSWTNNPESIWPVFILWDPFVYRVSFELVQHSFISVHTHAFRFPFSSTAPESMMGCKGMVQPTTASHESFDMAKSAWRYMYKTVVW